MRLLVRQGDIYIYTCCTSARVLQHADAVLLKHISCLVHDGDDNMILRYADDDDI